MEYFWKEAVSLLPSNNVVRRCSFPEKRKGGIISRIEEGGSGGRGLTRGGSMIHTLKNILIEMYSPIILPMMA